MNANDELNTEQVLRAELADQIKTVTLEELPTFIANVMDRDHDYGTICVALGSIAAAAAWACNKHEHGGITGFQAGAVFWEFARAWGSPSIGETGARFLNYDNLLFPQYAHTFTAISQDTFDRVKAAAAKNLADKEGAHPDVAAHWRSIVEGNVPFGLGIEAA